jgi:predicted DsbA family dithiol-disulfide isomerase
VVEEYVEAVNRYGISGIPSVVVNEEAVMVGAVPSEHYRHVIDNILETGVLPKKFSGDLPTV